MLALFRQRARRENRRALGVLAATLLVALIVTVAVDRRRRGNEPPVVTQAVPAVTSTTGRPGPPFTVAGSEIVGPAGTPFVPVGVNLMGPHGFWPVRTLGTSAAVQQRWGLNTVRIDTCLPGGCAGTGYDWHQNDDLDAIVREFTARRIVVILALLQFPSGTLPDAAALARATVFWQETARRFGANPYVWFNLLNEPGDDVPASPRWLDVNAALLTAIRATGAPNLVVVDGTQWGQEIHAPVDRPVEDAESAILTFGRRLADEDGRVVFSVHVYGNWAAGVGDAARDARLADFVRRVRAQGLALLFGEVGASGPGTPDGLAAATAYRVASSLGVGLVAWHGQRGGSAALVQNGDLGDVNDPLAPRNLTWNGSLLWQLARSG